VLLVCACAADALRQAMREYGFKPVTATLDLLTEACATANADDAPDVYAALRAHDVPEFVAYTASMQVRVSYFCTHGVFVYVCMCARACVCMCMCV
jgi:hypothetical protein